MIALPVFCRTDTVSVENWRLVGAFWGRDIVCGLAGLARLVLRLTVAVCGACSPRKKKAPSYLLLGANALMMRCGYGAPVFGFLVCSKYPLMSSTIDRNR